jgi:hypothetical protein
MFHFFDSDFIFCTQSCAAEFWHASLKGSHVCTQIYESATAVVAAVVAGNQVAYSSVVMPGSSFCVCVVRVEFF